MSPYRHIGGALAVCVGYWLLAKYSLSLPVKSSGISYIWPADGLALAALLCTRRRLWPLYLAAVFIGTFLASNKPLELNLLYATFNVTEPFLVAFTIHRVMGERPAIDSLFKTGRLVFLILGMMAVAIFFSNTVDWLLHSGGSFFRTYVIWYVSDTLGMLVVAPMALAFSRQWQVEWQDANASQRLEGLLLVVGSALACTYFLSRDVRMPPSANLIPILFMLWGAVRFGMLGAGVTLAIFTLFAFRFTSEGLGPFAMHFGDLSQALVHLQMALMMITVLVLLAAARTVEWRRALADSEAVRKRLEFAIEASGTVAFETHSSTAQILWSGDVENVLGIERRELATIGQWVEMLHPDDRARVEASHRALVAGEMPFLSNEYRLRRRQGDEIIIAADAYAVPAGERRDGTEPGGMNVMGILRNVTQARQAEEAKRKLEARVVQAERLEAIGALAGGIAHDFNNILSAILGYAEMLDAKTEPGSRARKYVQTIAAAGERGKALVAQILAFSRTPEAQKRPVDMRTLMEEVAATIRGSLPAGVWLRESIGERALVTHGSAMHLHQLAMNLCTNAVQSMPGGGELAITMDVVEIEAERVLRGGVLVPGHHLRLEIEDQGVGIDAAALPRIFEPFYSTKALGKGTGLGLSIAHGVAIAHGGAIDVSSHPGIGTKFSVYLPQSIAAPVLAKSVAHGLPKGNGEAILVVDDEAALVELSQDLLAELGYEPVAFTSSMRALHAFSASPGRYAAVLTDEMMPELAGTELCARIRELSPSIPVLVATAYGGDGFETRAADAGATCLLRKPYNRLELATALATALRPSAAPMSAQSTTTSSLQMNP